MSTTDWVDEERPDCGCIVWHTCGRENSTENGTVLAGTMSTTDDTRERTVGFTEDEWHSINCYRRQMGYRCERCSAIARAARERAAVRAVAEVTDG